MGGYMATHAEAERDLAETKAAFQAAAESLNWYNQDSACKSRAAATAAGVGGLGGVGVSIFGAGSIVSMLPGAAANAAARPVLVRPGLVAGAAGVAGAVLGC